MVKALNKILSRLRDLFFPCEKTLNTLVSDLLVSVENNTKAVCELNVICHNNDVLNRLTKTVAQK